MKVSRQIAARKMTSYLRHRISLDALVDWAERAIMDGQFVGEDAASIRDVVARLGLADVRAFGLSWDDCLQLLRELGYSANVEVHAT